MTIDSSAEIHSLRATVRDLLALSTIPEAWVGREPSAIATDLADLLIGSLGLDFAFVRLCDPTGGQLVEVTRGNSWKAFPEWLKEHLAAFGQISRKEIVTNVGGLGESRCGIVIPIGVNSERGLVAAASDRPDFPDQIDQQLLSVAANNAATAFQNAFLIKELRSAQDALRANEQALRNARDELEIKVAERTSELQRSAQGLQRSEFYLAEGQRLAHTGSWALTPAGFEYWSSELFQIHGLDPTGNPPTKEEYLALVHPEDREFVEQEIQKMLTTHRAFDFTKRILRPDGQIRSVRCVGVPATQAGTFRGFVGTGMDVTEQEQLIEAVRKSEGELRQILDFAPQLIGVYGPNRERLYLNHVALDYLGLSLEEWRQTQAPGAFVHPDDRARDRDYFDNALSAGSAYELELRLRKGDGTYRWFLARSNPVRDDKGQIRRWYVTCTDIEDRKRAEEKLQQENVALREEIDRASMFEEIVGTSPALQTVLSRISKVAPTDSTVLITGETGTGKELVARAIHRRSNRASRAFVSVNCAAIPRDLIASELFGHEKGAFTGAMQRRIGRFELAEGGTIFLDEVGELSADTQVALLRVLQEREFERVGGRQSIHVDVRVIAATNRDLKTAVASGNFREDLYYRINVFPLEVPPLRARRADIPLLVEYFVDRYARKAGKNIRSVDKRTLQLLQSYPWPGNIRELQNIIERSVIVCETEIFTVDESWLSEQSHEERSGGKLYLSQQLADKEKEVIEEALRESQGRVVGPLGAAAKLGIARSTLESKIQSLNINKNRFKAKPRS
jgi:formate hydrogenlyase transcriptional activator